MVVVDGVVVVAWSSVVRQTCSSLVQLISASAVAAAVWSVVAVMELASSQIDCMAQCHPSTDVVTLVAVGDRYTTISNAPHAIQTA